MIAFSYLYKHHNELHFECKQLTNLVVISSLNMIGMQFCGFFLPTI